MPHDINGTELSEGDEVVIRYIVKQITRGIEYCNCQLESVHGRRPDSLTESFCGNIGVCEKVDPTEAGTERIKSITKGVGAKDRYPELFNAVWETLQPEDAK